MMSPLISAFLNWIRQPSSVTGISAVTAAAIGVVSGQVAPATAMPAFVFGVVAILLPDNSAAQADARKVVADALVVEHAASTAPTDTVVGDVAALAADLGRTATPHLSGAQPVSAGPV